MNEREQVEIGSGDVGAMPAGVRNSVDTEHIGPFLVGQQVPDNMLGVIPGSFHSIEGLYFKRYPTGDVRILKTKQLLNGDTGKPTGQSIVQMDMVLPFSIFASVVASMSKSGEGDGRYYKAAEFLAE